MTLTQIMSLARGLFANSSFEEEPILEIELLLMAALNINRVQLYLEPDRALDPEMEAKFWELFDRFQGGEPTAYITGNREFYGLDFYVNPDVLIPRPESELLVEKALGFAQNHPVFTIADIGTGCGAIAISLAQNLPQTRIYATDISDTALQIAELNSEKHEVSYRVSLLQGDLLDLLPEPVDLIIANLPYVRESDMPQVNTVNFEPDLALNGGPDGLDKIRRLIKQAGRKLRPGGCLLLEIGQGQKEAVTALLRNIFPSAEIEVTPDLSGIDRVVSLTLR